MKKTGKRKAPRLFVITLSSVLFAGVVAVDVVATGPGIVELHGKCWSVPIPAPHIRISKSSGHAQYLVLGDEGLAAFLGAEAPRYGWHYDEQMGSGHMLSREGMRLVVTRQQWGASFVVRLDFDLYP